jgi:hypothetical protein
MDMRELTHVPLELYTGRTLIQVQKGTLTVCRISQVYPEVEVEQAANSAALIVGLLADTMSGASFLAHAPDGFYECPLEVLGAAQFATTCTLRELFLQCATDWQAYARQQGGVVTFQVMADGGIVDKTVQDPVAAIDLYLQIQESYHILRLYVQFYGNEGDETPREETALLKDGEYVDLL